MISLRAMTIDDAEIVRTWRNTAEVASHMFTDHTITVKEHDMWVKMVLGDPRSKYWIVMCDLDAVGLLSVDRIDILNSRCYWHFYIANRNNRGRGIGSYCEYYLLHYVFEELKLNKVCGEVISTNEVMLKIHWSFGFQKEGYLRRHIKKSEGFVDVVLIGMFREEWLRNKSAIEHRLRVKGLL